MYYHALLNSGIILSNCSIVIAGDVVNETPLNLLNTTEAFIASWIPGKLTIIDRKSYNRIIEAKPGKSHY